MRKIFIGLLAAALSLLVITIPISPASADDVVYTELTTFPADSEPDPSPARGCTSRRVDKGTQFKVVDGNGDMRFKGTVWSTIFYDHCTYDDNIRYVAYRVRVDDYVNNPDGGGPCAWVDHININVAPLTGYNPPYKTFECDQGTWTRGNVIVKKDNPSDAEATIGHAASDRCATTSMRVWIPTATFPDELVDWTSGQGCLG